MTAAITPLIRKARDVEFTVSGLTITGQEWGQPGDIPVMALHGWLDNSASFDVLAPQLSGVHLIALDMAGHGRSSHRAPGSPYHIWQDVGEIFEIADQLGWQRFALMGHSRGGIISCLAAGTFPERITHVALIDGFRPGTTSPEEAPQQLARAIIETKRVKDRGFAVYPDVDTAIIVRQRSEIPVSFDAAKILTTRGLIQRDEGYTWSSDPHLKIASGFRLTEAHCDAFIDRITAPMTLIIADDGLPRLKESHERSIERFPHVEALRLTGGHHLHMETAASEIAAHFNQFFQRFY